MSSAQNRTKGAKPKQLKKPVTQVAVQRKLPAVPAQTLKAAQQKNLQIMPHGSQATPQGGADRYEEAELKRMKNKIRKEELRAIKVQDTKGSIRLVEHIPDCTTHYVSARLFPFETIAGACLPQSDFTFPSAKLKVIASGAMVLGTSGIGYIVFCPKWGNDSGGVVCTTAASVGGLATALSGYTNLSTTNFPELPYAAASFGDNLQGRYLAGGIRATYTGKLMDQNGMMYLHCDPNHSSVSGNTPAQLINLQHTRRRVITGNVGVGERWNGQVLDNGPVVPNETAFSSAAQVWADPYMVLICTGAAGDSYYFEVAMHVEFIGRVVPNETPSHTDPANFPIVDGTIKEAFETGPPQKEDSGGIIKTIGEGISSLLPRIVSTISGLKPLGGLIEGLMKMVPLTGSNAMLTGMNGWSGPTNLLERTKPITYEEYQKRIAVIEAGKAKGTNLWVSPKDSFMKDFLDTCIELDVDPADFVTFVVRMMQTQDPVKKRKSIPYGST